MILNSCVSSAMVGTRFMSFCFSSADPHEAPQGYCSYYGVHANKMLTTMATM